MRKNVKSLLSVSFKLLLSWREVEGLQDSGLHAGHERDSVGHDVVPALAIPGRFTTTFTISQISVAPKQGYSN